MFRYVDRLVYGIDGNHSLQKKTKKDDPDDVPLGAGAGFFINHKDVAHLIAENYKSDDDQLVRVLQIVNI